jgi:uncharacterized protein (TIGR04168 family)
MRTIKDFMARLYNVHDMGESAQRIMQLIQSAVPPSNSLIIMGHNGPAGLGAQRHNICGVDWVKEAGDHGDPDLASVLQQLREAGRDVALVVFGHMHHKLRGRRRAEGWLPGKAVPGVVRRCAVLAWHDNKHKLTPVGQSSAAAGKD